MEETLHHQTTTQCTGLSSSGTGNHHPNGTQADHELTITVDPSDRAAQHQPSKTAPQIGRQ
nr:hypothetical protein [Ruegeria arenilitoris]